MTPSAGMQGHCELGAVTGVPEHVPDQRVGHGGQVDRGTGTREGWSAPVSL